MYGNEIERSTMMLARKDGSRWRAMMRVVVLPPRRAATTKSSSANESNLPRNLACQVRPAK